MAPQRNVLVLSISVALCLAVTGAIPEEEDRFVGWKGDTFEPGKESLDSQTVSDANRQWIETISWQPRAFIYHNFLSQQECDHLVELGSKRVSRSLVVDSATGGSKLDNIRTSFGGAFEQGEDSIIAELELRMAEWTHIPPEHGEPIQILRYMNGQQYAAHWDYFHDEHHQKAPEGNRCATVLMYLSDVEEGGETTLPLGVPIDEAKQATLNPSECAKTMGMAVKPRKGDALLFFDMDIEGQKQDRRALHASCPTLKGTKWTATKWIHNKPYIGKFNALELAGQCKDIARDCVSKARKGLCDTDPNLTGLAGICRLSCHDCEVCPEGDVLCYRRNMRSRRQGVTSIHSGS